MVIFLSIHMIIHHTLLDTRLFNTEHFHLHTIYTIAFTVSFRQSISNPRSMLHWGTLFQFSQSLYLHLFLTLSSFLSISLCLSHFPSQEDCQPCLPGYYCSAVGLSAPLGKCWEGFFCLGGADRPDPTLRDSRGGPCPKGNCCPQHNLDICVFIFKMTNVSKKTQKGDSQ